MDSSGVGHVHLQNNGFLEELFSDGLTKIESKMDLMLGMHV
jgi:hypothetical protein